METWPHPRPRRRQIRLSHWLLSGICALSGKRQAAVAPAAPGSGRVAAHRKAILYMVIPRSSAKGCSGGIAMSPENAFLLAAEARPEALRAFRPAFLFWHPASPPSSSAGGVGPSALSAITARGAPRTSRYASAPGRSAFAHLAQRRRDAPSSLRSEGNPIRRRLRRFSRGALQLDPGIFGQLGEIRGLQEIGRIRRRK